MIVFNRKKREFQITVHGDEREYFNTVKALSRLIACQEKECLDKQTIYYAAHLLEEMMPAEEQDVQVKLE